MNRLSVHNAIAPVFGNLSFTLGVVNADIFLNNGSTNLRGGFSPGYHTRVWCFYSGRSLIICRICIFQIKFYSSVFLSFEFGHNSAAFYPSLIFIVKIMRRKRRIERSYFVVRSCFLKCFGN